MTTTITTDHKWRNFHYGYEVPAKVRTSDFDWLDDSETSDGFFRYRGIWYHVSEFERRDGIPGFDAIHPDSFFSGVVLRLSRDGERYKVGTLIA